MYLTLAILIAGLGLVIAIIYIFLKKLSSVESVEQRENTVSNSQRYEPEEEEKEIERPQRNRRNEEDENIPRVRGNRPVNNEYRENVNQNRQIQPVEQTDIKLTKKDMAKMEKKKAKEEQREYQKQLIEAKKLREQEKEREYLEKEMKREEEKRIEEEYLKKIKADQEKKENDVFNQWKDTFQVAEEGEQNLDSNNEDLINEFINYIKLRKVVSLEDLSGQFKIHPNELVERLKVLEANGRICGIVDDRGKYIYLTEKEINSLLKIFMNRGRISKTELIKECNKIIRFTPTEEDKQKILEEQNKMLKNFEDEINKENKTNTK